jgi:uncharacterized membrane protein YphA (DoxX/SURF4 family)
MNLLFYGIEWHWKAHGRNRKFCRRNFSGKLLALMVIPFANVLPFGEVTAGALILFGLFTRAGLVLSGLLLVGLTFGTVMFGDAPTVARNLQYAFVNFGLLWFVELNRYSLDSIFRRKTAPGFTS